ALALGALVALWRFLDEGRRGWLWIAGALAAAVPLFKIFAGALLLLALGVAALRPRARRAVLAVGAPPALSVLLLWLHADRGLVAVVLDPVTTFARTRRRLGLAPVHGPALLAWALVWLVVSLGARLLALPETLRSLAAEAPPRVALAAFALAG